ncbi:MAG: hypothetical protein ACI841_001400 [Planctomycetota bacterium]|jgi:hypothetical protein
MLTGGAKNMDPASRTEKAKGLAIQFNSLSATEQLEPELAKLLGSAGREQATGEGRSSNESHSEAADQMRKMLEPVAEQMLRDSANSSGIPTVAPGNEELIQDAMRLLGDLPGFNGGFEGLQGLSNGATGRDAGAGFESSMKDVFNLLGDAESVGGENSDGAPGLNLEALTSQLEELLKKD